MSKNSSITEALREGDSFCYYTEFADTPGIEPDQNHYIICKELVENKGFEPLTPCVQGRCSGQLS